MKEKLIEQLIEARGLREYWRVRYNNAFIFDFYEDAMYRKWDEVVDTLEEMLADNYDFHV